MRDLSFLLRRMIEAGREAGAAIEEVASSSFHVQRKEDDSPVTEADLASNRILRKNLCFDEGIAYLSEEEEDDRRRLSFSDLFIVDPLDGTQDFIEKDGSYGINIAFVQDRRPTLAVIVLPTEGSYCYAVKGRGAYYVADGKEEKIHVSSRLSDLVYAVSKTHENERERNVYLRHRDRIASLVALGASRKGVELARGRVDATIRYTAMTKEWDTCAMDLIVTEAGGIFLDTKKNPFLYNREDVYNRDGYAMVNRRENLFLLD